MQMLMVISFTSLELPSGIENISNIIPPTYSMTQDGDTVIVILTTLNNHGCVQGTDSVQVITIADPVAHFMVDTAQDVIHLYKQIQQL